MLLLRAPGRVARDVNATLPRSCAHKRNGRLVRGRRALIFGDCVPLPHPGGPARGARRERQEATPLVVILLQTDKRRARCTPKACAPTRMTRFSGRVKQSSRRCISRSMASLGTSAKSMAVVDARRGGGGKGRLDVVRLYRLRRSSDSRSPGGCTQLRFTAGPARRRKPRA